ncbi:MAG TPA: recombinase family protein [Hanamia sp.]
MNIGYARISTQDQKFDLQLDALKKAGCKTIFKEAISGAKRERPELKKAMEKLREGDSLVVWKLDRLGRSLRDLIDIVTTLHENKVSFISISDNLNTTTPQGRLIFNIFGSLAEFERELIKERTNAGLSAARARGRLGGRRPGLSKEFQQKAGSIKLAYDSKENSIAEICENFSVSTATLYKCIRFVEERNQKKEHKKSHSIPGK